MPDLFVSHSTEDDAFVRELQRALGDQGVNVWIDSRELVPGGLLAPMSPGRFLRRRPLPSWSVRLRCSLHGSARRLRYALEVQKQRGRDKFPVIPLSLDGTKLGVLEEFFGTQPAYIPVSSAAGGAEAAVHPLLVATGTAETRRCCSDPAARGQSVRGPRSRTYRPWV